MILAIFGGIFTLGTIFLQNIFGLYCLVAVSACMSLMFPTIYGIALKGMGDDAKWSGRSYYGDPGRLGTTSVTGKYH